MQIIDQGLSALSMLLPACITLLAAMMGFTRIPVISERGTRGRRFAPRLPPAA